MRRLLIGFLVLSACQSGPSEKERKIQVLIEGVHRELAILTPQLGPEASAYATAVSALLAAVVDGTDTEELFTAVRTAEPLAHQSLMDHGRTAEEADQILSLVRLALLALEVAVA